MRSEHFPGMAVALHVNGQALQEYQTEETADLIPTTTAFIEATPGVKFTVNYNAGPQQYQGTDDCQVEVFLDGAKASGMVWEQKIESVYPRAMVLSGFRSNSSGVPILQAFTFAELQTTDGAPKANETDGAMKLGEIAVKLTRCYMASRKRQQEATQAFKPLLSAAVPEKALKGRAMSSRTKLGDVQQIAPFDVAELTYPYGKDPFAVFTFKYRSHKDLQIEGLIERSPSPVPIKDRDPDDLTPEELREQNRVLREKARKNTNVKQETKREKRARSTVTLGDDDDDEYDQDSDEVFVTNNKRRKRARDTETEVIDLS